MPVYIVQCPDCEHEFRSLILAGTLPPEAWFCSKCGGERAVPKPGAALEKHPWERERSAKDGHGYSCLCCAG